MAPIDSYMTSPKTQGPTNVPVRTDSDSLTPRVASLPASIRHRLLSNVVSTGLTLPCVPASLCASSPHVQGVSEAQFPSEQPVKGTDWGFATKLPAVQRPVLETSNRTCQLDTNVHQHDSGTWLPERITADTKWVRDFSRDCIRAGYFAALHESRIFNCPDCVDAMAEAFGVAAAVSHLRVRSSTQHSQTPNCSNMTIVLLLQGILVTLHANAAGIHCELSAE